jgi:hypothetical protein
MADLIPVDCDCCGLKSPFIIRFPAEQLSRAYFMVCSTCEKDLMRTLKQMQMIVNLQLMGVVCQMGLGFNNLVPIVQPKLDKPIEQVTH